MSIWESIKVDDSSEDRSSGSGDHFIIQYGTESVKVPCSENLTLAKAMEQYAARIGYKAGRAVTFRHGQSVVSASQVGEAGTRYMASVQMETKG